MKKTTLQIEGMSCSHCVNAVTQALQALNGVDKVQVSLEEKTASVSYQPDKVEIEAMRGAIEDQGFEVL